MSRACRVQAWYFRHVTEASRGADRTRIWRARRRDYVRSLQFRIMDLEAQLARYEEAITMLRGQLRWHNRKDQLRNWLDMKSPADDGEEPEN